MLLSVFAFRNSRKNKKFGRGVVTAAGFALLAGVFGVSWSVRAGIFSPPALWLAPVLADPAEVAPPKQQEEPEISTEESRAINMLMYRDRDRERLLFHAQASLEQGDLSTALEHLQRILDFPEDLFVWRKSDGKLVSLRSEAARMLRTLPPGDLAAYERMVSADAGVLLKDAAKRWDANLFEQVARRYYHTAQGFQATHWCATRWFDHGYFELAAQAWESLESHPLHATRFTKTMRKQRDLARQLVERSSKQPAQPLVRLASNQVFEVATTGTRLDVNLPLPAEERKLPRASWELFQGGWNRSEAVAATTPFLNPDWVISYREHASDAVGKSIELWEDRQGKALQSLATAFFPVVVNQYVVFRDFHGIRCIDRQTGKEQWSYRCQTSLQREMDHLDEKHGSGGVHSSRSSTYVQMQSAYAGNSVLGQLSSDGQRVYAVDAMLIDATSGEHSGGSPASQNIDPRKCNQLISLPLSTVSNASPAWVIGGDGTKATAEPALVGHFFRGPPLPVDGRLYLVSECRNQLNLLSLDAETGKLLWKQGIAFADESFEVDQDRYPLACPIAFADGVLVCPTQTGLLVGVEAMSGVLLWSYCYSEELYENDSRGWRDRFRKTWGCPGFPAVPKIQGQRVVLLPRQSNEIHCVDLRSGGRLWTAPREDAEYVGALTEESVFIVGQRYCRGLSLSAGEQLWSARFGMPAGQGVFADDQYLLPLQTGRIATIDLKSGREIGLSGWRNSNRLGQTSADLSELSTRVGLPATRLPDGWRTGNLIPAGDQILAAGPAGLIAFPQTGELLHRKLRNQMLAAPDDLPTRLLAAELQLNLGELAAAKTNLESALTPQNSHQLRPHGEFLLRELLFRQLETEPNFALPILDELEALVTSPADRGRFLMRKANYQLRTGNPVAAMESAQALIRLDYADPLPWPGNAEHTIAPRSFAARLMKHIRSRLEPGELARIDRDVERVCVDILERGTVPQMQRFLSLYDAWPQSASVRQRLAERARDRGEFQHAEFLWLKNRESQDPVVVAEATRHLMDLWNQLGLYSEAAVMAEELASSKFRDVPLQGGHVPEDILSQIPMQSLLAEAIKRRTLPTRRIPRVEIEEDRWMDSGLPWTWETIPQSGKTEEAPVNAFEQYRREFSLEPGSSFQLLDKGWIDESGNEPETRVAVIDRAAGLIKGKIRIPLRNSYPSLSKRAHVGHFFPVGSSNRMTGISLLEIADEQPLWKTKLGDDASHQHILRVGPAGPDYCTFQGQQELVVLDPISGQPLWKRADIDPSSGLVSDPYAGMFGDAEVLVVFGSNRSSFTVYHTGTGEELHHGELDIDTGQIRRIFGSKLFYIANADDGRRMRIWDFAQNRLVFDEPAGSRIYTALTPDHELVVLIPPSNDEDDECDKPSRLQILDVINNNKLLDLEIPAEDLKNLNYVRAFRHGGQFYVNLQRSVQMPVERLFSYYASDAFPPVENVQGDLLAVHPESGKILWQRSLPQRSILTMPHLRLPFLVTISRVRDRWQGGKQGLLVEILDAETGETIAYKDNNLSDRVVNLAYDRAEGLLDLNGLKTRIRLKFGPALPNLPNSEVPL